MPQKILSVQPLSLLWVSVLLSWVKDELCLAFIVCHDHLNHEYCISHRKTRTNARFHSHCEYMLLCKHRPSNITVKAPVSPCYFLILILQGLYKRMYIMCILIWLPLWLELWWASGCLLCSGDHYMGCIHTSPAWSDWRGWKTPLTTGILWRPSGKEPTVKSLKSPTRKMDVKQRRRFWILLM